MAIVRLFSQDVRVDGIQISCDDKLIEKSLRAGVPDDLPEGYFVTMEHAVVAMLEALGGEVVTPPAVPETKEGRVY